MGGVVAKRMADCNPLKRSNADSLFPALRDGAEQRLPDVLFQPSNTENNGVSGCNAVRCS
jgi:hypothetical protein